MNKINNSFKIKSNRKSFNWAIALSFIALIVSGVAIAVALPRAHDLSFDYFGVIVGMLSLFITALLGWNIYALLDFNRVREEVVGLTDLYKEAIMKNNTIVYHTAGDIFNHLTYKEKNAYNTYELCLFYRISELVCFLDIENKEGAYEVASMVNVLLDAPLSVDKSVSRVLKKEMLDLLALAQVKSDNAYTSLIEKVSAIPLSDNHAQNEQKKK